MYCIFFEREREREIGSLQCFQFLYDLITDVRWVVSVRSSSRDGVTEKLHYVGTIRCGDVVERQLVFGNEGERLGRRFQILVDLVDCNKTGDFRPELSQLVVPFAQIFVGDFSDGVENQYGAVGLVVVGRV